MNDGCEALIGSVCAYGDTVTLGDEVRELTAGKAVHVPPNVPHATEVLEDTEIVSCKGVLDGVGHRI